MSSRGDRECSQVVAVGFRPFREIAGSEDSGVLSEADKADESGKEDIFNRDKMMNQVRKTSLIER